MYPSSTSKEQFLNKVLDTFDGEGDQDYAEFTKKYINMFGREAFNNLTKSVVSVNTNNIVIGGSTVTGTSNVNQEVLQAGMGSFANSLKSKVDEFISDKIDPAYKEIKQAPMFDVGAITSVSNDAAEVKRLTTAVQKYFTDKPIGENLKVTIQGPPGDNVGSTEFNDAGIAELTGKDLSGYTVKKIGYQPVAGSKGMFLVELNKGGDNPDNIVGLIDGQQLAGTELDKAVNRPEVSVARMINKLNPRSTDAAPRIRTVRLYDADGNIDPSRYMQVHVRTGESGSPEVAIGFSENGKPATPGKWIPQNSDRLIAMLNARYSDGKPMYELLD
jgi:hypothetical protein